MALCLRLLLHAFFMGKAHNTLCCVLRLQNCTSPDNAELQGTHAPQHTSLRPGGRSVCVAGAHCSTALTRLLVAAEHTHAG